MSQKNSNLIHLKQALSSIDKKYQATATNVGLLATSGLSHIQQMPDMCHLFQKLFNLQSCGFFWADLDGNMQDAWSLSPELLSFKTLMSCLEFQASRDRAWPTFQENMLMGAVAGYLLPFQNERFYASPHFRATYYTMNVKHILDVVLHDGKRPLGILLMMRSVKQGRFTPDERSLLVKLIPILNKAFDTQEITDRQYSEREMTGFALVGQDGKYKSMSDEARRIVWTLTHTQPGSFADPSDPSTEFHLEQFVAGYKAKLALEEKFSVDMENRWGQFKVSFEMESASRDIIVMLRRKVPLSSQLAFYLSKLDFPPMRQMVTWLLVQNQSRSQIASTLGISVETVTSHVKLIYKATGSSSSCSLLLKLAN